MLDCPTFNNKIYTLIVENQLIIINIFNLCIKNPTSNIFRTKSNSSKRMDNNFQVQSKKSLIQPLKSLFFKQKIII